jgi:hypothetical protein
MDMHIEEEKNLFSAPNISRWTNEEGRISEKGFKKMQCGLEWLGFEKTAMKYLRQHLGQMDQFS